MKIQRFIISILALLPMAATAGDIITYVDGSKLEVKILEVGISEISYKKASNPNGPIYEERKRDILRIDYENGTSDVFQKLRKSREPLNRYDRSNWELQSRITAFEYSVTPQADFLLGYNVNNHFRFGLGFGVAIKEYCYKKDSDIKYCYENDNEHITVFPVFGSVKYSVLTTRVTPYLSGCFGYSIPTGVLYVAHPTLYADFAAGIELRLKQGSVFVEFGGEINDWRLTDYAANNKTKHYRENTNGRHIGLGYTFFLKK